MNRLKLFWEYGTKKPVQRVGLIILTIGLIISILWANDQLFYHSDASYLSLPEYLNIVVNDPPKYRDGYFYVYPYLLLIGLLMTWLHNLSSKVVVLFFKWITENK